MTSFKDNRPEQQLEFVAAKSFETGLTQLHYKMSKIIFDSGISLDGFFAGDNRSPKNPMGAVSGQIYSWMFNQKAFWEYLRLEGGREDGPDGKFIRETIERTGVFIR